MFLNKKTAMNRSSLPSGIGRTLIMVFTAAPFFFSSACSSKPRTFPAGIALVREMEYIPEVDGWQQCTTSATAGDSVRIAAAWDSVCSRVEELLPAAAVRNLSLWAKKEMRGYRRVPSLKNLSFSPLTERTDHHKTVWTAVGDTLPSHSSAVRRLLTFYLLFDRTTGKIITVTVTIRGTRNE